ncbi:hypothetical protein F5148DRAFT_1286187 [Russula earlei]|uniref:Uncharacterized protein n=1 Tax=Russula earlei TaxID=71964 RepID=A0ACC0U639_9AGAM|nr:hypothetical protein F5148DRAFT_1286187 [Russula earlei]
MRNFFSKNKLVVLYGSSLAGILLLLKWLEYRFVIIDHAFELYIGAIALLFTGLGIWVTLKLAKPKIQTVVVEKEVYLTQPAAGFIPDENTLSKTGISKREWEVLVLMSEGLSNQEIAERLFVSLNTIKTHSSNLFEKLEAIKSKITRKYEPGLNTEAEFYAHHSPKLKPMKKTVLICGLIAGLISTSLYIGLILLGKAGDIDFKNGMLYGYTLMLLGFAFIFVGTKITRDKHNGGTITFGKAFLVGLYITLIASTIYVLVWLIDYYCFIPDFAEKYNVHILAQLKASGASQSEIARQTVKMSEFSKMYQNPFFVILFTYMEILPVGLVISLISALVFKRKSIVHSR